jgi:hypothetical protein
LRRSQRLISESDRKEARDREEEEEYTGILRRELTTSKEDLSLIHHPHLGERIKKGSRLKKRSTILTLIQMKIFIIKIQFVNHLLRNQDNSTMIKAVRISAMKMLKDALKGIVPPQIKIHL